MDQSRLSQALTLLPYLDPRQPWDLLKGIGQSFGTMADVTGKAIGGGFVDPQDYGKVTANVANTMLGPSGGGLGAQGPAGPFYSKLGEEVGKMQPKASGQQLVATLKNAGVKPEELDWTGFQKQFADKPQVTKEEAQSFLKDNPVDVQEVVKGQPNAQRYTELPQGYHVAQPDPHGAPNAFELRSPRRRALTERFYANNQDEANAIGLERLQANRPKGDTKFSQYQLPGGENYKELLLTLPNKATPATAMEHYGIRAADWNALNPDTKHELTMQAAERSGFKSSHYDEPNVLAHVRFNDRTDATGKKTLFLEEVQSDWHQKGRKQGYQGELPPGFKIRPHVNGEGFIVTDSRGNGMAMGKTEALAIKKFEELHQTPGEAIPNAPFKTTWPDLALKRMIKYAVDNGYDSVSWTPGKVQAERYDLSKQIDALTYDPASKRLRALKKTGDSFGQPVYGNTLIDKTIEPAQLADTVGKEAAEKLLKTKQLGGVHMLEGQDLRVGGEGMNAFYDKMLPAAANKLGKKYGSKVGVTKIGERPNSDIYDHNIKYHEVWSLPITDAMRAEVGKKGMPLFSGGLSGILSQALQNQKQEPLGDMLTKAMGNRS